MKDNQNDNMTPKKHETTHDTQCQKMRYEKPRVQCLGKLSMLIKGGTGQDRDAFPYSGGSQV